MKRNLLQSRQGGALLILLMIMAAPWCIGSAMDVQQSIQVVQSLSGDSNQDLSREFIDISTYLSAHYQQQAGVCSFESAKTPEETLLEIQRLLEEKSWTCVPGEDGICASFFKDEGIFRWAYVSCGMVDGVTVVVSNVI